MLITEKVFIQTRTDIAVSLMENLHGLTWELSLDELPSIARDKWNDCLNMAMDMMEAIEIQAEGYHV